MKKVSMIIAMCTMSLFIFSSMSHAAAITCKPMELVIVGTSGFWATNTSGSSCGAIKNGDSQYFTYLEADKDRLLAVLLLAVSLEKSVSLYALGDTQGSIAAGISIIQ